MLPRAAWLAILALPLAGCLDGAADDSGPAVGPLLAAEGADVADAGAPSLRWASSATAGTGRHPAWEEGLAYCLMDQCRDPPAECTPGSCERHAVRLDVPAGWWDGHDGFLELSIRWPSTSDDWFQTRIEDSAGNAVAAGEAGYMGPFGLVARLDRPAAGPYTAVVVHASGDGPYEAVVEVESRPRAAAARDLLPDLVTLPPTDLTFEEPEAEGPGYFAVVPGGLVAPVHGAVGSQGCATEEAAAQGARKCLRFTNAVANLGEGPLEIRLPVEQGAAASAGGHFTQRVHRSDGGWGDRAAGGAEFHAMHAHWHNAAANRYAVYGYDPVAGERGALVNEGRKAGVCFADIGLAGLGLPHTAPGRFSGAPCLNPAFSNDWVMGLSSNWYDAYHRALVDQYIEMTGAPDGTYALCSVTNQDGTLLESRADNNEACTVFRMAGATVEVLSEEPYHKLPAQAGP